MQTRDPHASPADAVQHPSHYTGPVPGVECIDVTQHFNFNRGNAIKYVWRAGAKGGPEKEVEDLRKAIKYLEFELARLGHAVQPAAMPPSRWHADPARDATWVPDAVPSSRPALDTRTAAQRHMPGGYWRLPARSVRP